jgi:hypothetical protein
VLKVHKPLSIPVNQLSLQTLLPSLQVQNPLQVVTSLKQKLVCLLLELLYLILKVSNNLHSLSVLNILLGEKADNPGDVPSSSSEMTSQVICDNPTKFL